MHYGDKVRVTSGFYKKQKGIIKVMNDGFIGTLGGTRIYSDCNYKLQLEDGFITDFIHESSLELIQ